MLCKNFAVYSDSPLRQHSVDLIPSGQDELAWHSTDLFGKTEINSL